MRERKRLGTAAVNGLRLYGMGRQQSECRRKLE
jgi:hypothetical protein